MKIRPAGMSQNSVVVRLTRADMRCSFQRFRRDCLRHPEIEKLVDHHELLNKAGGPGYDYWMDMAAVNLPDDEFTDGVIAGRISRRMAEHKDGGKPFFLAAGFRRPHLLWVAPNEYFDLYPPAQMKLAEFPKDDLNDIPKMALARRATEMSPLPASTAIASYYACVSFMDAQLGKLMATDGQAEAVGQHDRRLHQRSRLASRRARSLWGKVSLFEESAKVPIIIAAPGIKPATSPRTVEMLDFYPTLTDLAGLSTPKQLDGVSLRPLLNDPR